MPTEIKNRWTGAVILTVDADSLRDANLSGANLSYADLSGVDLSGANLSGADLLGANLRDANLRDANLSRANLRDANLSGADLRGANLSRADLSDADLSGAYLSGATGNLTHVKSLHADRWAVTYTADRMFIGCQAHPLTDWWGFDDRTINAMDIGALKWWRKWKPILQAMVEASPAEPTKVETEQAV